MPKFRTASSPSTKYFTGYSSVCFCSSPASHSRLASFFTALREDLQRRAKERGLTVTEDGEIVEIARV